MRKKIRSLFQLPLAIGLFALMASAPSFAAKAPDPRPDDSAHDRVIDLSPYFEYFFDHPAVADASIDAVDKTTETYFWKYIVALEKSGRLEMEIPGDLLACPAEGCSYIEFTADEAARIHAAKMAHAIWLELHRLVPWRLASYKAADLDRLFTKRLLFEGHETSGWGVMYLVDHSPSELYSYMVDHGHIETTKFDTLNSVLGDIRSDFTHGVLGRHPIYHAYTALDALTEYDIWGHRVSRWGCHTMSELLVAMLRAVNIPGEVIHCNDFYDRGCHASADWPILWRVMVHGDDVYRRDLMSIPDHLLLPHYWFIEVSRTLEPCFDDLPCIGQRYLALRALAHPGHWILNRCRDPERYGHVNCEAYLTERYGDYLTEAELEDAIADILGMI